MAEPSAPDSAASQPPTATTPIDHTGDRIEPLLSSGTIAGRVAQLGREITGHYLTGGRGGQPLVVLGVMTGGLVFCADLIRAIDRPLRLDVLHARSYRGRSTTPGELHLAADMMPDVTGANLLIVDDIFDSGRTLTRIVSEMRPRDPLSIATAVLLSKQVPRADGVTLQPDWVGFEIADRFVVGYGLDYDGHHRGRSDIGMLSNRG